MYAYNELYLDDAMAHIGEMLDYVVRDLKYDIDEYWTMFVNSRIGKLFQEGNPKYNAGMSGIELAREVFFEIKNETITTQATRAVDCSKEYWAGWALAYYQHQKNISFKKLYEYGVTIESVMDMYILHEADLQQFVDRIDVIVTESESFKENRLKRLRKYAELTQKQLADKSGVSLRMIQLYEQGQNDITKAQASVVVNLAQALNCSVEKLLL